MKRYDFILIGTGQATGTVISGLLDKRLKIAVIEESRTGGTCVNWGCTPTKTFISSARDAHMVRRGGDFGIKVSDFSIDFSKVMERVNDIRESNSSGLEGWLKKVTDFYSGSASFTGDHTVQVGDDEIYGEEIIIHTGTRARVPSIEGLADIPWVDNRGILDLTELPEHLIIVGASYIGLEFAQAFRRLGSRVSVIGRGSRIVPGEDIDISEAALDILAKEGIEFFLDAGLSHVQKSEGQISATVKRNRREPSSPEYPDRQGESAVGEDTVLMGDVLLLAVGRVPNTDRLNLSGAGVKTDSRGFVSVDDYCRTSVPHIYALGDVNGKGAFTHTSVHDGQVFLDRINGGPRKISSRIPIHSMFIDPPLARVGMSQREAEKAGKSFRVAVRPMSRINRAIEKDETGGLIKLIVEDNTDLVLGATVFGVGGDEIIGMMALLMQASLPYTKLREVVLPHPTVSELIPWIFDDLK